MVNKRLFLVFKKSDYFYRYCNDADMQCEQLFSENSFLFFIAHILKKIGFPVLSLFYNRWKHHINGYNTIVFTDYAYLPGVAHYIRKKNSTCKLFFYYMNDIDVESQKYKYLGFENVKKVFEDRIITYNQSDSLKYRISYKPTMYKNSLSFQNNTIPEIDIIYLGVDKNRGCYIEKLFFKLKNYYTLSFKIFGNNGPLGIKNKIDYNDYINDLWKSRAVLDIVTENKEAVSLRFMEALFYHKKLITNNDAIKSLPVYNCMKDNTLFIDIERIDVNKIISFMNKPITDCSSFTNEFIFENWLSNLE